MKPFYSVDFNITKVEFWEMELLGEKYHVRALPNETRQEFVDRFFNQPVLAPVVLEDLVVDSMDYLPKDLMHEFYENLAKQSIPTGYNIMDAYGIKKETK